jgi:dolichol-phosphate mannosyltransferase
LPAEPSTWVILPTYEEAENLEPIAAAILERLGDEDHLLVVDDASPDGTGEIADRLATEREDLSVLHRDRKGGIGPAYVAGFATALAAGADLVVQMDADFSHDPAALPELIAAAADADLVLGSRYVDGGAVAEWGPTRRLISRGGSAYARAVLGVGFRDLTGGFKVFRRAVLEAIGYETIPARGYAFQVETTFRALRAGFRVVEVPIVFRERRVGASKMSGSIVLEAVLRVPMMRLSGRRDYTL